MDWILEHLQVLFAIAIAVVAILQKLKQTHSGEEPPEAPPPDSADAERTRRIQEEIRRRIMERRGLTPVASPPLDSASTTPGLPEPPPMIAEARPLAVAPVRVAPAAVVATDSYAADVERQRQLIEQFRELEASRQASTVTVTVPGPAGETAPTRRLLPDLRSREGLRRAIVLREILGPPVGLK